jgi:hypothetical protein
MENGYTTWKSSFWFGDGIPHYYGDKVRQLFIGTAVLSFVVMPLWGDLLPFVGIIPQVGAGLLLVLLAGFTSARNVLVMIANATVSAISILLLESSAIALQNTGMYKSELFLARELGVLLMLGALYFSIKTVRAQLSGKLGHFDSPLEFDETAPLVGINPEAQRLQNISEYDGD